MNPCLKSISYIVLTSKVIVQILCKQFVTIFCCSSFLAGLGVSLDYTGFLPCAPTALVECHEWMHRTRQV